MSSSDEDELPSKRSRLNTYDEEVNFSDHVDEFVDDDPPELRIEAEDEGTRVACEQSILEQSLVLLERSFPGFIKKNCPTELGKTPSMCYHNKNDPNAISPNAIPVTQLCCLTIPCTALVSGASYFREFDLSTDIGRTLCRLLRFLLLAFCDPALGTDPNHTDPIRNPRTSFLGRQLGRDDQVAPKVVPIVEPLFRNHCHMTMAPNARGVPVPTPGAPFTKTEMFETDNVLGYRVWFFVTDASIDLTKALVARIRKNKVEMGDDEEYLMISENDPGMQGLFDTVFKGDVNKFLNFINKQNNSAKKANAENHKNMHLFSMRRAMTKNADLLPYEIVGITELYNLGRVKLNQCYACKSNLLCDECAELPPASEKIFENMRTAFELTAIYEEERQEALREGREPGPPPDLTVTYKNAKFTNLPPSNLVARLMDGSMHFNDETLAHLIKEFVDPGYYLIHTNPSTMKMLEGIGVCARQRDPDWYTDMGASTHTPVRFAFPEYIFAFSSADCNRPNFFNFRLPWVYDHFDMLMTCIEEIISRQKKAAAIRDSARFFASVSGGEDLVTLRSTETSNKRILNTLPGQIPIELQGREFTEADQAFAPSFLAIPSTLSDISDNSIVAENAFRTATLETVKKMERLKGVARYIDTVTMHHLLKVLRAQGLREFKRLAVPDSKTSFIMRAAAKTALALTRSNSSAYFPTSLVASNLGSFANYIAQFYFYFESEGMLHNHNVLLDLVFAVYRAAHCPLTDALFGVTTLCNHIVMQGTAGMGKSFTTDVLKRMIIDGSAYASSSMSARAMNSPMIREGTARIHDEIPQYLVPQTGRVDPKLADAISQIKEVITAGRLTHEVPQLSTGANGGPEDVAGRKTVKIVSIVHEAIIIAGNCYAINPSDNSLNSRIELRIINQPGVRYGASDITCKAAPFGAADIGRVISSPVGMMRTVKQREHSLVVMYCELLSLGAVGYPCLDMYSVLFNNVYKVLSPVFPGLVTNNRMTEQMTSRALSMTIGHAIYLVFSSIWSPLTKFDHASQTVEFIPFCVDQLKLAEPLTFFSEEASISLIAQTFHNSYMPAVNWEIALKVAEMFANFSLEPNPGFEPNYYTTEKNGVVFVNENYVQCMGTVGDIVRMLGSVGVNGPSAHLILKSLATNFIACRAFIPYAVATPTSSSNVVASSLLSRASQRRTDEAIKMALCEITAPIEKVGFGNDDLNFNASSIRINTHYLRKFSPKQITDMVIAACCHSGTRRRTIAINIPYAQLPFVMQTVEIAPNDVELSMDFSDTTDSHVRSAFSFDHLPFTGESHNSASSASSYSSSNNTRKKTRLRDVDIETYLCQQWLERNVVLPVDSSYYTPKAIDAEIARRTAAFSNEQPVNYPEDIISKYTRLLPRFTPPSDISSDPGSSGIETRTTFVNSEEAESARIGAIANRLNNVPYVQRHAPVSSDLNKHPQGFRSHTASSASSSSVAYMSDDYDDFD